MRTRQSLLGRRLAVAGVAGLLASGCIPLSGGRVIAPKQVAVRADGLLVARDASTCRGRRWGRAKPGGTVWCVWHRPVRLAER